MERVVLKPERFYSLPSDSNSEKDWIHWRQTLLNFFDSLPREGNQQGGEGEVETRNARQKLINFVSSSVYEFIQKIALTTTLLFKS